MDRKTTETGCDSPIYVGLAWKCGTAYVCVPYGQIRNLEVIEQRTNPSVPDDIHDGIVHEVPKLEKTTFAFTFELDGEKIKQITSKRPDDRERYLDFRYVGELAGP